MRASIKLIITALLIFVFGLLWFGCGDDDDVTNSSGDPNNQAPVIDSMTASPDTFLADLQLTTVTVFAQDPDGDPLNFSWEAHSTGSWLTDISGAANVMEFSNCCPISEIKSGEVVAVVNDGQGGEKRDSITVWVKPQ